MSLCFKCGSEFTGKPARGDDCQKCGQALRCCKNCERYNPSAYNECSDPSAERIVDKEKGNFCDLFLANTKTTTGAKATSKSETMQRLEELFKR